MLLTRPEPAASRSARRFAALGHEVVVAPLMEMAPLRPSRWPVIADDTILALTSERAVEAMTGDPELSRRWRALADRACFAVGARTAEAARGAGLRDIRIAGGTLQSLVALIVAARPPAGVLYLAGRDRSGDLVGALAGRGIRADMVEVYEMAARPVIDAATRAALSGGAPVVAPCYSRRSAEILAVALAGWAERPPITFLALSEQVGEPLERMGRCLVAACPDEEALVALLDGTC